MGRKSKLTEQVRKDITGYIQMGHFTSVAAALAGVSESTLYRWLEKGRTAKSGKYREFWEAIEKSKAYAEAKYLEAVREISNDERHKDRLKAATWWLERRHAGRYSPKTILEHQGEIGVRDRVVDLEELTPKQRQILLEDNSG